MPVIRKARTSVQTLYVFLALGKLPQYYNIYLLKYFVKLCRPRASDVTGTVKAINLTGR